MASLYIHIPFCERKCIYCDFYSVENLQPMARFLPAVKSEISRYADEFSEKESFETIFFGGGTPSLLEPRQLERILDQLHSKYRIDPDSEITLETNPGTVDLDKLRSFRSLGINRLSIGIQSFHQDELKFLSRIHNVDEAEECVRDAYRSGFDNVSIDLIFALPHQSAERWRANLRRALALEPRHISAYSLIVEEGTPLFAMVKNKIVSPVPERVEAAMYETTIDLLEAAGYRQYEVSNYALVGYESRHNKNYWNHSNYLGFGPSAHSFWRDSMLDGKRWWNVRSILGYCEMIDGGRKPIGGQELVGPSELFEEEVFLGLRTGAVNAGKLRKMYGRDVLSQHALKLKEYLDGGLLHIERDNILLTRKGFMMCDAIAASLL